MAPLLSPPAHSRRHEFHAFVHHHECRVFSFPMTSKQIPQQMASWMLTQGLSFVAFLLLVNVILLAAGNFMDPGAIVPIMVPILFPVTAALAMHLGILMAVNMEVVLCHPPVWAEPLCGVGHYENGDW